MRNRFLSFTLTLVMCFGAFFGMAARAAAPIPSSSGFYPVAWISSNAVAFSRNFEGPFEIWIECTGKNDLFRGQGAFGITVPRRGSDVPTENSNIIEGIHFCFGLIELNYLKDLIKKISADVIRWKGLNTSPIEDFSKPISVSLMKCPAFFKRLVDLFLDGLSDDHAKAFLAGVILIHLRMTTAQH